MRPRPARSRAAPLLTRAGCRLPRQVVLGVRNCVRPHALLTTGVSWLAVRLCAPDALHLVWDSGTVEIVFGCVPLETNILRARVLACRESLTCAFHSAAAVSCSR
jgi:hypothetical protein